MPPSIAAAAPAPSPPQPKADAPGSGRRATPEKENVVFVEGKAYDLQRLRRLHPGGDIVSFFGGREAGTVYATYHRRRAEDSRLLAACALEEKNAEAEEEEQRKRAGLVRGHDSSRFRFFFSLFLSLSLSSFSSL